MHPELFELKALVGGRLDAHRRREIDDHLGSCAECSRQYVAMMLGSASPKTAEAEARQGLVASNGAHTFAGGAGSVDAAPAYGIDAPIMPFVPRPTGRTPHNNIPALETEFHPAPADATASSNLVDVIAQLRAENAAMKAEAPVPAPAPIVAKVAEPAHTTAPVRESFDALAPSIFAPTPTGGMSMIMPISGPLDADQDFGTMPGLGGMEPMHELPAFGDAHPTTVLESYAPENFAAVEIAAVETAAVEAAPVEAAPRVVSERPMFVMRASPVPPVDASAPSARPELVVTFSSTPQRSPSHRSPSASAAVRSAMDVTLSVPTVSAFAAPAPAFHVEPTTHTAPALRSRQALIGMAIAAVVVLVIGISGVRYFRSSVNEAAAAAAATAAKDVQAAAARTAVARPGTANAGAPVQTRIVYVEKPSRRDKERTKLEVVSGTPTPTSVPAVPVTIALPDVNVSTGGGESSTQLNTQRSATSELTRSARATASRTAVPRP